MRTFITLGLLVSLLFFGLAFSQTNQWMTDYTTFDDASNGTGQRTASVAVVGPDQFVALVTQTPFAPVLDNLFDPPGNYLVGYWNADSANGRVPSPINGQQTTPQYNFDGQFTNWTYIVDQVNLKGAWQLAGGDSSFVYVANNDPAHNILVFRLTSAGVEATKYRMETGSENIYGIDVDDNGNVYVVDYEGTDTKTDEVKVFAGIQTAGTTWGIFGAHNDAPIATIDLPAGTYQGITVNSDGSAIFVSATSARSIWKFTGDPVSGYTQDPAFSFTLSPDDTVDNGGSGTPSVLGLAYLDDPQFVFAAVDTFLSRGLAGGYPYGRIYAVDANSGAVRDTIDIAAWNFALTGAYDTGSNNGRAGGFASVWDVDTEPTEKAVYTQTYYGWAVEKWIFDGDLHVLGIKQTSSTIPQKFGLQQNYPNPFNPSTSIKFEIKETAHVTLNIYNVMGQQVASLVNRTLTPGSYETTFDASDLSAGIYFYQLRAGHFSAVRKMVLSK